MGAQSPLALVYDTETTGLIKHPNARKEHQPRIIEWGGVLVNTQTYEVVDEMAMLIHPGVNSLDAKITKITGLTMEDLKDAPQFAQAAEVIRPFFSRAGVLVAHNAPFDVGMMRLDIERCAVKDWPWPGRIICTVQEHYEEWGRRPRLLELYKHYTDEPLNQTHRALDDVYGLVEVCRYAGIFK